MRSTPLHPTDADLIRALDGESEQDAEHARQCRECAARMAVLRGRFARLSQLLARTDEPVRFVPVRAQAPRPRATTWLRAAVLALALLGVGATTWAAYRLLSSRTPAVARVTATAPAPAAAPAEPAVVSFLSSGPSLTVSLAARAPDGVLRIVAHTSDSISVSLPPGVPLQISERRIVIRNAPGQGGEFTLAVPGSVAEVLVLIAGDSTRLHAAELRAGITLSLTPGN